ncbi:MAG: hypothetical protein ACI8X5_001923 [Planctomycetota bacterium]|jgi:hypothetical protein
MKCSHLSLLGTLALLLASCNSTVLSIPTGAMGPEEQILGPVEAKVTGIMLFQIIPIGQNERFAGAYSEALAQQPGATRLVDVEIEETWWWGYIMNGYGFTVRGTAVK